MKVIKNTITVLPIITFNELVSGILVYLTTRCQMQRLDSVE
jgi:hypothetical protein